MEASSVITTPVTRTSSGLRDALFDEIDALRNGKTTAERARALAGLASQIVNSVSMDLEYHKQVSNNPAIALAQELPSLRLGMAA